MINFPFPVQSFIFPSLNKFTNIGPPFLEKCISNKSNPWNVLFQGNENRQKEWEDVQKGKKYLNDIYSKLKDIFKYLGKKWLYIDNMKFFICHAKLLHLVLQPDWDLAFSFYPYNVPAPWGLSAKSGRISTLESLFFL